MLGKLWVTLGMAGMLGGPAAWAAEKVTPKDAAAALVGGYTVVSGEKYGEKEPAERVEGTSVRFTEDRIIVTDKDKTEVYGSQYTLDTSESPYRITMTSKLGPSEGKIAKGLIEKKGDTLRLIYALPDGEAPTEFKTKAKQLMFVMKNTKK